MTLATLIKPKALREGATVAIVSPASAARPDRIHAGITHLERLGYIPRLFPHTLASGPLYYAGTLTQRLADLHAAFADPSIDAILCTRGGWGSAELLPHLDPALIAAHPKPFIGYSDHTSLHVFLQQQCNLVTFHGPMCAADFSRDTGPHLPSWRSALHISSAPGPWTLTPTEGLRTLRPGRAEGTLTGGCIAIYAEALGTPYTPRITRPTILFLEDIHTKPYQWDRLLLHIRYADLLEYVTGIVFGDMSQCVPPNDPTQQHLLEQAILHALRDFTGPIAIGLRSGHVDHANVTLPFGVAAHLDLTQPAHPQFHILEPAVTL